MAKESTRVIQIEISEAILNKLQWIHQGRVVEQLVPYALKSYIERMEALEGTIYPEDHKPEDVFQSISIED